MTKTVECSVFKKTLPALDKVPHPGEIGIRVYNHISAQAWQNWLEYLTKLINENRLNTANEANIDFIEQQMLGFFFAEGEYADIYP